jgi:hypothetical protein
MQSIPFVYTVNITKLHARLFLKEERKGKEKEKETGNRKEKEKDVLGLQLFLLVSRIMGQLFAAKDK